MSQTTLPRPVVCKYAPIDTPAVAVPGASVRWEAPLPKSAIVMLNGLVSSPDRQALGSIATTTTSADAAVSASRELDVPSTAAEKKEGGPEIEARDRPLPICGPYQPYHRSGATSAGSGRGTTWINRQAFSTIGIPPTTRPDFWCRDLFSQTAT